MCLLIAGFSWIWYYLSLLRDSHTLHRRVLQGCVRLLAEKRLSRVGNSDSQCEYT